MLINTGEYVVWRGPTTISLKKRLGEDTFRKLKFFINHPFSDRYFGTKNLELRDIDVLTPLYVKFLSCKSNANIINLRQRLIPKLKQGRELYFTYVYRSGVLIGGLISLVVEKGKNRMLGAAFKAYDDEYTIEGKSVSAFLDRLFFDLSKKIHITLLSCGKDRNGYGYGGANPGLAIHKLQMNFYPKTDMKKGEYSMMKISESEIRKCNSDVIFFAKPDKKGFYSHAYVRYGKNETINRGLYNIIKKRGITLDVIS